MIKQATILFACLCGVGSTWAGEAAQHLAEAVRIETVSYQKETGRNSHAAFREMHNYLRETYPLAHSRLELELVNDFSLLYTWRGSEPELRPVLFTAHFDVVPVEPGTEDDWTHPAFAGVIDDGVVYGRGTLDDKIGVISLMEALETLLKDGFEPRRSLYFGFGHDEEVGGVEGAGEIAATFQARGISFEWMLDEGGFVVADSPMLPGREMAGLGVAEKQSLTLVLVARGRGGHSSMPPAETTIGRLAKAVKTIEDNPFPTRLVEPMRTSLERTAPYLDFPTSFVFNNLWLTDWLVAYGMSMDPQSAFFVRTTTALTMFNAGIKDNVIPQSAEARINFRILPGEDHVTVIERVTHLIDDPGIEISVGRKSRADMPVAAMSGGGYDLIADAARRVYPDAVVLPSMLPATTDVRHYVDVADNHYRFRGHKIELAEAGGIHGTNEKIDVEGVERAVEVAVEILRATGNP